MIEKYSIHKDGAGYLCASLEDNYFFRIPKAHCKACAARRLIQLIPYARPETRGLRAPRACMVKLYAELAKQGTTFHVRTQKRGIRHVK